jgi:hypothetical protein
MAIRPPGRVTRTNSRAAAGVVADVLQHLVGKHHVKHGVVEGQRLPHRLRDASRAATRIADAITLNLNAEDVRCGAQKRGGVHP